MHRFPASLGLAVVVAFACHGEALAESHLTSPRQAHAAVPMSAAVGASAFGAALPPLYVELPGESPTPQADAFATPLSTTLSLPEDAFWEGFVAPAFTGNILGMTEHQGKLVVGGAFRAAGHDLTGGVVIWDGTQYELLPPVGTTSALGVWNDQIVAAVFRSGATYDILRFDGTVWDTLGTSNQTVNCFETWLGSLVIGGRFSSVNGVAATGVAAFDGTQWSAFGAGPGSDVQDLTLHEGKLVACGSLFSLKNIAQWNSSGGVWETVGSGFNSRVYNVASDEGYLYAVGEFTQTGDFPTTPMYHFARWDGASWTQLATTGTFPQVSPMVKWNGGLVLVRGVGASKLSFWDGTQLTSLPDSLAFGTPNSVSRLGTFDDKLVAAGNFVNNGSTLVSQQVLYDGASWSSMGSPWDAQMRSPGAGGISDMISWNGQLAVGGGFGISADTDHFTSTLGLGLWNGSSWSGPANGLRAQYKIFGGYQGDLVAVGGLLSIDGTSIQRVARWNGTSWSGLGTTAPDFGNFAQEFGGDLYVGHLDYSEFDYAGLGRWNGTMWQSVGGGLSHLPGDGNGSAWTACVTQPPIVSQQEDLSLTEFTPQLIVAGYFAHAGAVPAANVAAWDGTAWAALGDGLNDVVDGLVFWNNLVVAGGRFSASGSTPLDGAAYWDGTSWHQMGTNVDQIVDFAVDGNTLVGCGRFRLPDGTVIQTVAHWTGSDWRILGSGTNAWAIAIHGGHLYQAGTGLVHGHVSHNLSRLPLSTLGVPAPRAGLDVGLVASPNPGLRRTTLSFTLPVAGRARLVIVDVAGREVARLLDGHALAGSHDVRWDTPAAPGVYFAMLDVPGGSRRVTRVVRLD